MQKLLCCVALASLPMLAGCYVYIPLTPGAVPASGDPVALEITDAGRVGLSERFGPGLLRVEGRLTSNPSADYALNVHRVAFYAAPASRWSGELVRIDRGFVGSVRQRRLSRGRTTLAVGALVLAVGALFIGTDLVGFFNGDTNDPPGPPDPSSNRVGH